MKESAGINTGMKHTILQMCILHYSKKGKTYPYKLLKTLKQKKPMFETVSKNDVYNATASLAKNGFVKMYEDHDSRKRYCRITKKGTDVLMSSREIMFKNLKEVSKLLREN